MKTYSAKVSDIKKAWYLVDARDLVLGRAAVEIANVLRGKCKPSYTPHMDCGDYVVVVNAEHVYLTGRKMTDKLYMWHTGYPGGIKSRTAQKVLEGKTPGFALRKAVQRMIPRGPLGRLQLSHLKVYAGTEHPHGGQNPVVLDLASRHKKNMRRSV